MNSYDCPMTGAMRLWTNALWLLGAFLLLVASLSVQAASPNPVHAALTYKAWVAAGHLPGNPEGIAVDAQGNIYASIFGTGEIVRLDGHGGYTVVARIVDAEIAKDGATTGVEFDKKGNLYVAFMWHYSDEEERNPLHPACRDSRDVYTGVYKVDIRNKTVEPFVTKKSGWPGCFPDDIAFDEAGNMYFTDLTLSGIWKVRPDKSVTLWSTDPLIQWPPAPYHDFPEGANDMVYNRKENALYVATDGTPMIVRIPINTDGSAGPATVIVRDLGVTDGIELDETGNIYVSEIYKNQISVFSPDGKNRTVIATSDTAPLAGPTSLVLHDGVLCTSNLGEAPPGITEPRSVTCISGFQRPQP